MNKLLKKYLLLEINNILFSEAASLATKKDINKFILLFVRTATNPKIKSNFGSFQLISTGLNNFLEVINNNPNEIKKGTAIISALKTIMKIIDFQTFLSQELPKIKIAEINHIEELKKESPEEEETIRDLSTREYISDQEMKTLTNKVFQLLRKTERKPLYVRIDGLYQNTSSLFDGDFIKVFIENLSNASYVELETLVKSYSVLMPLANSIIKISFSSKPNELVRDILNDKV